MTLIDLSKIPPPKAIEELSLSEIMEEIKEILLRLMEESGIDYELLPSDLLYKYTEVVALREVGLRTRINQAVSDVLFAVATESNLDNIVLRYSEIGYTKKKERKKIPITRRMGEIDKDFKERSQYAIDSYTCGGSDRAYYYWVKYGSRLENIADAKSFVDADKVSTGEISIVVLYKNLGVLEKTVDPNELRNTIEKDNKIISNTLSGEMVRPQTDIPKVYAARLVYYSFEVDVFMPDGSDPEVLVVKIKERLNSYIERKYKIGADITESAIKGESYIDAGVSKIDVTLKDGDGELIDGDLHISDYEAPYIMLTDDLKYTYAVRVHVGKEGPSG